MKIIETYATQPATEQDIAQLERDIGHSLPFEYRAFLLENNGGVPTPKVIYFDTNDSEENSPIRSFFSVDVADPYYNIFTEIKRMPFDIDMGYLPIATDSFGNLIVIKLYKDNTGSIWFWDHEKYDEDDLIPALSWIASSFNEFTEKLEEF